MKERLKATLNKKRKNRRYQSYTQGHGSSPVLSAMSANLAPQKPLVPTSTTSPISNRLTADASMAPIPVRGGGG